MAEAEAGDEKKTSTSTNGDIEPPKEHGTLGYLLSQIPKKAQKGILVQCDLIMTCIDANQEYIAIGTNIGIIFMYDRKKTLMERLKTGSNNDVISCVSLHHGLEEQVAVGTTKGSVYIFQLPSLMPGKNKQLQKFTVSNVHKSSLSCVTWSLNGMKLFSGDQKGHVVCTEVDFYQGQCKSAILLVEIDTDIVQLHHSHRCLLVSTRHRTIVCRTDDKDQLIQIGQKERKVPGPFGGIFMPGLCKTDDAELYAVRPGMRIWRASIDGTVQATYLFKELINKPHKEISVLYYEKATPSKSTDLQFGCLSLYLDKYLVTWNQSTLFVLNPEDHSVIGSQNQLGTIVNVAVTQDEIFLLRKNTDRNLIRIAENPENSGSVYEKLLLEKRLADVATTTLQTSEDTSGAKSNASSPFKFIQTNIVDKIKNLDASNTTKRDSKSVTHLKASMDKFGHGFSDTDEEEELHHHGHHGNHHHHTNVSNDTPPEIKPVTELKGDLPPIVKLDSPDLLTVELFTGIPSNVQKAIQPLSPGNERFNPFLKDNLSDFEDDKVQTIEDPGADNSLENESVTTHDSADNMAAATDLTENSIPKPLVDRLTSDVLKDNDDIVFTTKPKRKKVKKKKARNQLQKPEEEDKLSITSADDISLGSVSPKVERKTLSDVDSLSIKSDISDKSVETPEKDISSLKENKHKKKTKDVFSKLDKNLEGLEKHLAGLPQGKSRENMHDSYLKNFENRAGVQLKSGFDDDNSGVTQQNLDSTDEVKKEHEEKISESSNDNDNKNTLGHETMATNSESSLQTVSEDGVKGHEDNIVASKNSMDDSVKPRTERTLSVEDSIYSKQTSVDDSETESVQHAQIMSDTEREPSVTYQDNPESRNHRQGEQYYKTPDSSLDDFYGKFGSVSSNLSAAGVEHPLSAPVDTKASVQVKGDNPVLEPDRKMESIHESEIAPSYKLVNNWTEIFTSGNILSLSLSNTHIWFVDKSNNIYYSSLSGTGIKWIKVNGYAKQIAVSRSGLIVWRLYKDTVYAGTKITNKRPEGMKWVDAVKEVQYIDVDDHCAWFIKTNGDIVMQKGLSKDRPCYKSMKIPCMYNLKQIICQSGVVWGLTNEYRIIYRSGITKSCPEGKEWHPLQKETDDLFSCITFGDGNVAWAINVLGRICFTNNVTMETPTGEGKWWQVPMSEIIVQDVTAVDALMSLAKKFDPQKLAYIMSTTKSGVITAGSGGVWVCPEFKNVLQICRGCMEGHSWEEVNLSGISSSMVWKLICATSSDHEYGLVWAQQPNGDIFTFSPESEKCNMISRPNDRHTFVRLSSCKEATWGLTDDGKIYIRGGLTSFCPQGTDWSNLDITQLGDVHLINLSCGSQSVWAVDSEGIVFQRLGVKAPSSHSLPSVWLPVDSGETETVFTQVISGTNDWMVWAIDNRRHVYARIGITDTMPIGTEWVHVPGTPATQLTVSNEYVWALNPNGEILCRYGIMKENPGGDYWRQIPGIFVQISTSSSNRLWGISREGKIYQRKTKYLLRRQQSHDPLLQDGSRNRSTASVSSDDGWELV